jgi:hypothetical protein
MSHIVGYLGCVAERWWNDLLDLCDHVLPILLETCKELLEFLCFSCPSTLFSSPSVLLKHLACIFRDLLQCHYGYVLWMDLRAHHWKRLIQL